MLFQNSFLASVSAELNTELTQLRKAQILFNIFI